jgi:hypothetical protein
VFRKPRESLISLFTARLGHPGPVEEEPPLVIRRADAEWSEEYREIRREMGFPG